MPKHFKEIHIAYFFCILAGIFLGISTRWWPDFYPDFIAEYGGDTFWAFTFFFVFRFILIDKSVAWLFLISLGFAFAIEFSQFYHAVWIDQIRTTTLGGLLLGFGFKFSDLLCYLSGNILAVLLDQLVIRKYC